MNGNFLEVLDEKSSCLHFDLALMMKQPVPFSLSLFPCPFFRPFPPFFPGQGI